MTIEADAEVIIVAVRKSNDAVSVKTTGGAVYDFLYEEYFVESVPQKDLYSKLQWSSISTMMTKLKEKTEV